MTRRNLVIAVAILAAFAFGLLVRTPTDRALEGCLADPVCAAEFLSGTPATITP